MQTPYYSPRAITRVGFRSAGSNKYLTLINTYINHLRTSQHFASDALELVNNIMQKTCKNEHCRRKFDKTSLSDLCNACSAAFKSGESQTHRRNENVSRQNKSRSEVFDTNRQLLGFEFPPPHVPLSTGTNLSIAPTLTSATKPPYLISTTSASGYKFVTTLPSSRSNQASTVNTTNERGMPPPSNDRIEDIHAMVAHLIKKSDEADQMKAKLSSNTERLDRMEAKLGKPDDLAVPLSLAIRNLPLPGSGEDDLQIVKAVLFKINAKDVNPEQDIVKVVRKGATYENPGTVFVELVSDEVRASVMKTKKVLEHHQNPCLRKIIIKNMKSQQELKMDIAMNEMLRKLPGGENLYIANNGHIREKTHQQRFSQNSFFNRIPNGPDHGYPQPRIQPPGPLQPTVQQPIFEINQAQDQGFRHPSPPQPQPSMSRAVLMGPTYTHSNPHQNFRPPFLSQPLVPMPTISLSATGPWASTALPPPTGPWPSTTLPPPTGHEQHMLAQTSCTASPEIRTNNPALLPLTSPQMDQSTNLTVTSSNPIISQANLAAVVSQANPDQQPAVTGQQLEQQNQNQNHQQQPAVVTSDIGDL